MREDLMWDQIIHSFPKKRHPLRDTFIAYSLFVGGVTLITAASVYCYSLVMTGLATRGW